MNKIIIYIISIFFIAISTSCSEDFLDQAPSDRPSEEVLFNSLGGAQVALNGIYSLQNYYYGEGTRGILAPDIMGEDCLVVSTNNYERYIGFYRYIFPTTSTTAYNFWRFSYRTIENCNVFLKNIDKITGEAADKNSLKSQALALRAFSYFNLVRWFGETAYTVDKNGRGVPINTTVNSLDGYNIPRSSVDKVYTQILSDLSDAEKFAKSFKYKGYIDSQAISAIQARVYLTMGDWEKASKYASKASSGFDLMDENTYLSGFNSTSSEVIWEQRFVDSKVNTFLSLPSFTYTSEDIIYNDVNKDGVINFKDVNQTTKGKNFVFGYNSLRVTRNFINKFANSDFRKKMFPVALTPQGDTIKDSDGKIIYAQWFTKNGSLTTKYKSAKSEALGTGDFPRIRASEMYLIKAEAEANLGNETAAQEALFKVQSRADTKAVKSNKNGSALLSEIYLERRKELFYEGHRFFDLKRLDQDLDRSKSSEEQWSNFTSINEPDKHKIRKNSISKRFCLPIPQDEINANSALEEKDQNEVYK